MRTRFSVLPLAALIAAIGLAGVSPALAQSSAIDGRVGKLEKEMQAVQRKVFPAGADRFFEPEITAPTAKPSSPGTPSNAPVTDLIARVDALESQLASLTSQTEQNGYKLRQLEEAFDTYKADMQARQAALAAPSVDDMAAPADGTTGSAADAPGPAPIARTGATSAPDTAAATGAIEKPDSGDAAEDTYIYGYRLWDAKRYAEAVEQLKIVPTKYPQHRRASFAQNLLGRAYLDDGKPNLAAFAFRDSYEKFPSGERAPDSLTYLGEALIQLKKPADACKVYQVLDDAYGATLAGNLRGMMEKGRVRAKCAA